MSQGWNSRRTGSGAAVGAEAIDTGVLVNGRNALALSVLREAFIRSEGGQASLVLVSGPSGIGKSALVRAFLEERRSAQADLVRDAAEVAGRRRMEAAISTLGHLLKHNDERVRTRSLDREGRR